MWTRLLDAALLMQFKTVCGMTIWWMIFLPTFTEKLQTKGAHQMLHERHFPWKVYVLWLSASNLKQLCLYHGTPHLHDKPQCISPGQMGYICLLYNNTCNSQSSKSNMTRNIWGAVLKDAYNYKCCLTSIIIYFVCRQVMCFIFLKRCVWALCLVCIELGLYFSMYCHH